MRSKDETQQSTSRHHRSRTLRSTDNRDSRHRKHRKHPGKDQRLRKTTTNSPRSTRKPRTSSQDDRPSMEKHAMMQTPHTRYIQKLLRSPITVAQKNNSPLAKKRLGDQGNIFFVMGLFLALILTSCTPTTTKISMTTHGTIINENKQETQQETDMKDLQTHKEFQQFKKKHGINTTQAINLLLKEYNNQNPPGTVKKTTGAQEIEITPVQCTYDKKTKCVDHVMCQAKHLGMLYDWEGGKFKSITVVQDAS